MKRFRGFSLVELMVAITLALVVTTGVVSVFVGSRNAFESTAGIAALSDNGRFALNFIENAVRDSGNMACGAPVRTIINANAEPTPLYYTAGPGPALLFQPFTGFEAVNTGVGNAYVLGTAAGALTNWTPNLDAAFGSLGTLPIKNNDVLVVRSSTQGGQPAFVTATTPTTMTVNALGALAAGQLAIVSDCVKSVIFEITSTAGNVLTHSTGGVPGNISATFPPQIDFAAGSQVTPLQTTAYYVGVGADGDGALFSANVAANNSLTGIELVPNIEAMQILYGLDTNASQTVSQYVTANLVPDFTSVISIHVAVLAAGPIGSAAMPPAARQYNLLGTTVTAPRDTRARQVFDVTIAARNLIP